MLMKCVGEGSIRKMERSLWRRTGMMLVRIVTMEGRKGRDGEQTRVYRLAKTDVETEPSRSRRSLQVDHWMRGAALDFVL